MQRPPQWGVPHRMNYGNVPNARFHRHCHAYGNALHHNTAAYNTRNANYDEYAARTENTWSGSSAEPSASNHTDSKTEQDAAQYFLSSLVDGTDEPAPNMDEEGQFGTPQNERDALSIAEVVDNSSLLLGDEKLEPIPGNELCSGGAGCEGDTLANHPKDTPGGYFSSEVNPAGSCKSVERDLEDSGREYGETHACPPAREEGADIKRFRPRANDPSEVYERRVEIGDVGRLFNDRAFATPPARFTLPARAGAMNGDGSGDSAAAFTLFSSDPLRPAHRRNIHGFHVSLFDQLLAVLSRSATQLWRKPCSIFVEIIIPIIFVLLCMIMYFCLTNPVVTDYNFVTFPIIQQYSKPAAYGGLERKYMCSSDPRNFKGLPRCSPEVGFTPSCSGDNDSIPLKTLCHNRLFSGIEIASTYVNSVNGSFAYVPTFDAIVAYQWLAKKFITNDNQSSNIKPDGITFSTRSSLNALTFSGRLLFAPDTPVVRTLVEYFMSSTNASFFPLVFDKVYSTVEAAHEAVEQSSEPTWAIIEVNSLTVDNFDVTIRVKTFSVPSFAHFIDPYYSGVQQPGRSELYVVSGFTTLQKMVYEYYLERVLGVNMTALDMEPYVATMGTHKSPANSLILNAGPIVSFVLVLAFLCPVAMLTTRIVVEKELRIREAMLIMGLSQVPLYISWLLIYLAECVVIAVITCIIVKVSFLPLTDPLLVFSVTFLYSISTAALAGLLSTFFSKSRLATLITPLIYLVFSVPYFAITNASRAVIIGLSIFSPTAYAAALNIMLTHEAAGGFTNKDFHGTFDDPTMAVQLGMIAADTVIYYILMLYFDAVLPRDWGTPKHPLFFIIDPIKCVCCCSKSKAEAGPDGRAENGDFEDDDDNEINAVSIVGLRKEFKRGRKSFIAVNNLYWSMPDNGVSVLLGHNGAGKSTTMNMMTGMLEPDAGDCYIYGNSVRYDLKKVRQEVGFCPQHNILWPELTCREHLEFFGRIKGLRGWELEDAVTEMLLEVDLQRKQNHPVRALSGGQKRKLSVAVAFVGGSRLVFLDEPTAGMDVGARRHTWELLRRMSETHSILLTTHYMDEADLLGHRIGIMSNGRLRCSGSSLFLKSCLGVGYSLSVSTDFYVEHYPIIDLVRRTVPKASVLTQYPGELTFQLPNSSVRFFGRVLAAFERSADSFGIIGYSLSATTLEEVLLAVAMEDEAGPRSIKQMDANELLHVIFGSTVIADNSKVAASQFKAMMKKRFWNALRDRKMQCFQVVCPVLCILAAMLLMLIKFHTATSFELSESVYRGGSSMDLNGCNRLLGPQATSSKLAQHVKYTNWNSTGDVSWYQADTWYQTPAPRYSSISCNDTKLFEDLVSSGKEYAPKRTPTFVLYNTSSYVGSAVGIANLYKGISWANGGGSTMMRMVAGLLPQTKDEKKEDNTIKTILSGAIIMLPFTFLPSNPVAWVVKERQCKALHIQNICGLRFFVYWIANFMFDVVMYFITMFMAIIIFAIFDRSEFISPENFGPTIVLLIVYGLTSTVMAYLISFIFTDAANAQTVVTAACFILGFVLSILVFILSIMGSTKNASDKMRWAFRLIPPYCVAEGMINLSILPLEQSAYSKSPWDMDVIGWPCVYMAIEFPIFIIATLIVDHPLRRTARQRHMYAPDMPTVKKRKEDLDVQEEREIAQKFAASDEKNALDVAVVDLYKKYDNEVVAVNQLCFSVMSGEIFGFLGTNGAGKTTTISILCQELLPTSGRAYVCGYDVVENSREALQCIGYCPQFDATLDLLTVEEHLYLYAAVRGIIPEQRKDVVNSLMFLCGVSEYRKTLSHELSGGNRRKLSVAMALVGGPRVLLLDEPSTGLDPIARRELWTTIQRVAPNCAVVLTTHHLEEVEALADRVAIMVDGELRCIGNKTHLKNKYGSGFEMSICVEESDRRDDVEAYIGFRFPTAELKECHGRRFVYALPKGTLLSKALDTLEKGRAQLGITDYSVSQTTLEQVFLRICQEQERSH